MQNVQNAQNAEIQQKVINLVELYRTKVGKESEIAKSAKEEHDYWEQESINAMIEEGLPGVGIYGEGPHTEEWIKHLQVNEQLLGHFYAEAAGENAEKEILDQLLPDFYDKTIFTAEEEDFLKSYFKEMVNYIISTPNDESLELVNKCDNKDICLIPNEVLDLIASRISIPDNATIYDPFAGFAQFANIYHGRKYFFEDSYEVFLRRWNNVRDAANSPVKVENIGWQKAWMKIAVFANKVDAEIIEDGILPKSYDAVLSYLPQIPIIEENENFAKISKIEGMTVAEKISSAYQNLKEDGVMGLLIPCTQLYDNEERTSKFKAFTDMIIKEGALIEIVQLSSVMSSDSDFCLLVVKKGQCDTTALIDARFASKRSSKKNFPEFFDMEAFNAMIQNNGKEVITGLRKIVQLPMQELNPVLLLPQVYVVERPYDVECPIPLSKLGYLTTTCIRDLQFDLPEDTPWVKLEDLSHTFKGSLDITKLEKADCPNNPPYVEGSNDYIFSSSGKFEDNYWAQMYSKKGRHVCFYRSCTYLDGKKEAVLFWPTDKGVGTAIVQTSDRPIAVGKWIKVFVPKEGIDALTVVATLRIPVVFRQLKAYEMFGLAKHLDDILVPTDKRVITDERLRMEKEESATKKFSDDFVAMKTEYINEVRMRKHDMGQYIFELMNIEDLMRYYLDNKKDEKFFFEQIRKLLNNFRDSLRELSTMLDNLSKEEQFGEPEPIDIQEFLLKLENRHQADGYKIHTNLDLRALRDYKEKIAKAMGISVSLEDIDSTVPMLFVSRNDLQRMVNNILDNAHKHGFTDSNRKDYEIQVWVSIDANKKMFQFDFRNNGNPLPEGMNKMRYGIKGEKAGQTGGTGIGGNYVKSFVDHYGGDYDIFMENEWTVVRICLPII